MKIAHIADTHLLNLNRHDEFKEIFSKLYEICRRQNVDYIVHCGDIAHTKTQISPEFVEVAGDFFKNLASIAPTYIILGNHDVNLKNDTRQDAISPIVKALNLPNLQVLKYSGEVEVNDNLTLNVLSRLDEENWKKPTNPEKINIALYHGAISGVQTDGGFVLSGGDHNINALEGHDFAFLGDIHKTNQILDTEGRVRYPGSTVQGNFGEYDDKGFLIWDIKSKDEFSCRHYHIPNPKPFVTIELDDDGNVPNTYIKAGSRVRVLANKSVSLEKSKKAVDVIKSRYSPENVTFVSKTGNKLNKSVSLTDAVFESDNLRNAVVQERLIRNFLKDYKAEEEVIQKVLELNKRFSSSVEETEEIFRNVKWKLKSLEWSNLFNYGENNQINFDNLSGVVGIFGKNYSGKSSVIDSLIYTIYNTTSKNNRKNLNVINQNCEKAFGKAQIEIDGELYNIERKSEKYTKKIKGVETTEAKTDVEFTSDAGSLNGLARNDTDKIIRKYFGSVDDFFLTSMSSQFGYLSFISEGSTKRKEILAKFLDLETFEKKFKMAKDESSEIKALLKRLEINNYDRDIATAELEAVVAEKSIIQSKKCLQTLKDALKEEKSFFEEISKKIDNAPTEVIDYEDLKNKIVALKNNLNKLKQENFIFIEENEKHQKIINKADEILLSINNQQIIEGEQKLDDLKNKIEPLEKEISRLTNELNNASHKLKLLESVPCGDQFQSCKFIKDAFGSKEVFPKLKDSLKEKENNFEELNVEYSQLDEKITDLVNKKSKVAIKKAESEKVLTTNLLKIEKNNVNVEKTTNLIFTLENKIEIYLNNREAIENYQQLLLKKQEKNKKIEEIEVGISRNEKEIADLYRKHGSASEKVTLLTKQKDELEVIRKEYAAYDLFLKCMHANGISYEIIKQKLPEINLEIDKILTNVVNFSVFLVNDDDKLDIMIKHPKHEPRPLEMGSGAEKTLASTAIRLALIGVTSLPVGDTFILDEPGTALDQENLEGFVRILELIKSYFKTIILISHLDSLKDCVDTEILIEKKDGFAYINQ